MIRGAVDLFGTSDENVDCTSPGLEISLCPSPAVPEQSPREPGYGSFGDHSVFVPVQKGLEYTSPYRPKVSSQAESLHEKIERYKQLRSTILSNVMSRKSPVKDEIMEEIRTISSPRSARKPDDPVQQLFISDQDDALGDEDAKHSPVDRPLKNGLSHTWSPEPPDWLTSPRREELYSLKVDDLIDLNTSKTDFTSPNGRLGTTGRLKASPRELSASKKMEDDFLSHEHHSNSRLSTFDLDLDLDIEDETDDILRISPLKTQPLGFFSKAERHVTFNPEETVKTSPESYKQLFSLDVEDLDMEGFGHSNEREYGKEIRSCLFIYFF